MKDTACILACGLLVLAGCAAHPADSEALAGKWKVEKIMGEPFAGDAELSFDGQTSLLASYAGCNRMNTRYSSEGKGRLNFGYTASTRMSCPENQADAEQRISYAFTQTEHSASAAAACCWKTGRAKCCCRRRECAGSQSHRKTGRLKITAINPHNPGKAILRPCIDSPNPCLNHAGIMKFRHTH